MRGGIFTGDEAANLGGSFDNDADDNIFKATFGSSFGSLSFGAVARAGLEKEFLMHDLTVVGSRIPQKTTVSGNSSLNLIRPPVSAGRFISTARASSAISSKRRN